MAVIAAVGALFLLGTVLSFLCTMCALCNKIAKKTVHNFDREERRKSQLKIVPSTESMDVDSRSVTSNSESSLPKVSVKRGSITHPDSAGFTGRHRGVSPKAKPYTYTLGDPLALVSQSDMSARLEGKDDLHYSEEKKASDRGVSSISTHPASRLYAHPGPESDLSSRQDMQEKLYFSEEGSARISEISKKHESEDGGTSHLNAIKNQFSYSGERSAKVKEKSVISDKEIGNYESAMFHVHSETSAKVASPKKDQKVPKATSKGKLKKPDISNITQVVTSPSTSSKIWQRITDSKIFKMRNERISGYEYSDLTS